MAYHFDAPTNRRGTNSLKWDIPEQELPMWVADMDFETAPGIREALRKRVEHGIFGYTVVPDAWREAVAGWWERRHGFRMGLMEIAQESGMIAKMTKGIRPFLKFMFPRLPEDHPAGEYITTNLIANVLGLGWACTPAGLKAMEQLAELEKQRAEQRRIEQQRMQPVNRQLRPVAGQGTEKGRQGSEDRRYGAEATAASNEMCTFLILNISSLQLIPVNMIAYRSQYGSANPAVIIAPALVATLFSTIIAIIYCKWKDR